MTQTFSLTERQRKANRLLGGDASNIMLFGGSRSGKTFVLLRAVVTRAIKAASSRHAILRFRFNHVKASVGLDTLPKMMELCFPEVPYKIDKTDWFMTLPNRSEVWLGGLDDKERTEKILGQEYATIFLNECSQIPYSARLMAETRLAQECGLKLKMYHDCNPPPKSHWTYQLFHDKIDPDARRPVQNPDDYAAMRLNPVDNTENLPESYLKRLQALPPRFKKRFFDGEFADANPNALFTQENIDTYRAIDGVELPDMVRVIVAVDPSGADEDENKNNDEIGISVCGLGTDGNAYVFEDLTLKDGPAVWGAVATSAYDRHKADLVVGEGNFGGAMVQYVIQTAKPGIPYKSVTASRGKMVRAEPISALYHQGKVRHVGNFTELEDELCAFSTVGYTGARSPNRADALIWALTEIFPGLTEEEFEDEPMRRGRSVGGGGWMAA